MAEQLQSINGNGYFKNHSFLEMPLLLPKNALFRRTTERSFECVLVIVYYMHSTIKGRLLDDFSLFHLKNYCFSSGSTTINAMVMV